MATSRSICLAAILLLLLAAVPRVRTAQQPGSPKPNGPVTIDLPFIEARPVLESLRADLLPTELRATPGPDLAAFWPAWVSQHDRAIRGRLDRGDEDSIVNLLLFGVTFTKRPRVTERDVPPPGRSDELPETPLVQGRLTDLIAGIASPGTNERLIFARHVAERSGFDPETAIGLERLRRHLVENLRRVLAENDAYARSRTAEQSAGARGAERADGGTFFRDRGLSSDTSIFPDFAVDQALTSLKNNGLLRPDAIRRVAIVGPGLDFTDKRDGYDFYPQQTLQPFAIIDSLMRLGAAKDGMLRVTTFDLSPRVNQHLEHARERAQAKESYPLNVPRDTAVGWQPELAAYWERFGDQIGEPASFSAPSSAGSVIVRSIRVRPAIVASVVPRDLNIVLQRLEPLGPDEQFDLLIATNVLVYYSVFEQCLALTNIGRMLRPGGWFLSNTDLPLLPAVPIVRFGYTEMVYTDRANAADRLNWFQRMN
jgi:SAM-dependent methyltransferase